MKLNALPGGIINQAINQWRDWCDASRDQLMPPQDLYPPSAQSLSIPHRLSRIAVRPQTIDDNRGHHTHPVGEAAGSSHRRETPFEDHSIPFSGNPHSFDGFPFWIRLVNRERTLNQWIRDLRVSISCGGNLNRGITE
jgi:hypothetical protein